VPDATGLELIAQELRDADADAVLDTVFFRDRAALLVAPRSVPATLQSLRAKGYGFLASVHGLDYFPEEPRLGVHYELLDMRRVDRITVRTRVTVEEPVAAEPVGPRLAWPAPVAEPVAAERVEPTLRVKQAGPEHRHARLQLLRELFGLEEPSAAPVQEQSAEVRPLQRRGAS